MHNRTSEDANDNAHLGTHKRALPNVLLNLVLAP